MIKGLYLHSLPPFVTEESLLSYGVERKIKAQCKAFSNYFDIEEKILYQEDTSTTFHKIYSRLPFTAISEKWQWEDVYKDIDFIYFRKNIVDNSIVRFFRIVKKNNPRCKIILEIPTYPYDQEEFKKLKDLPFKLKDRINRQLLKKYVDRITTFTSQAPKIFGIPNICVMNGIDYESVPISTSTPNYKTINIVIMSLFSHWHGFERLIEGLYHFIGSRKYDIKLHFVGKGEAIPKYKELVKNYQLEENVIFYGALHGDDLNKVFERCDLACDSLGLHRLGLEFSSTLKSREYCARGIPILCSSKIDFINADFPYFLELPANDDPIDFKTISEFYEKIYIDKNTKVIRSSIREYGRQKVDMVNTVKEIVDYIENDYSITQANA